MKLAGRWRRNVIILLVLVVPGLVVLTTNTASGTTDTWPTGTWTIEVTGEGGVAVPEFTVTRVQLSELPRLFGPRPVVFWKNTITGRRYPLDVPVPSHNGTFVFHIVETDVLLRSLQDTWYILGCIRWHRRVDLKMGLRIHAPGYLARTVDLADLVAGPLTHCVQLKRDSEG
jgi:hypothetical protein